MNKYNSYKKTQYPWMGEIPSHWHDINPKALFVQRKDKAQEGERQLTASQQYGILYQDEYMALTGNKVVTVQKDFDILKHVESGDFVISMRSFQGGLEYSTVSGSISSAYVMLIPNLKMVYPPFYRWLLKSSAYIKALQSTTDLVRDGQAMRYSNFAKVRLLYVPMEEQKAIANYLDRECAKVDDLIEQGKKSIDEYKKWKASIIYEAITKGVDSKVEMRNSSVEWIGMMPAHWPIRELFQLVTQVKNKNIGLQEQNLLSLSYGKIKRKDINTTDGLLPASFDGYNIIEADDIVLRLTDLQNDHTSLRVGRSTERGIVTSAYVTIRPIAGVNSQYLYYVLHAFDLKKGLYGMGSGVRQGLNYDEIKTLKIPYAPAEDQISIVEYLDSICDRIDGVIAEKQSLLADLEAYRRSLINETVTGKRKVV